MTWKRINRNIVEALIICFLLGYYNGPRGKICNDDKHIIKDRQECESAIKELGYQPNHNFYRYSGTDVPSGCSVKILSQGQVIWPHLTASQGLGKGHSDFTPICKGPENAGNLNCAPEV